MVRALGSWRDVCCLSLLSHKRSALFQREKMDNGGAARSEWTTTTTTTAAQEADTAVLILLSTCIEKREREIGGSQRQGQVDRPNDGVNRRLAVSPASTTKTPKRGRDGGGVGLARVKCPRTTIQYNGVQSATRSKGYSRSPAKTTNAWRAPLAMSNYFVQLHSIQRNQIRPCAGRAAIRLRIGAQPTHTQRALLSFFRRLLVPTAI